MKNKNTLIVNFIGAPSSGKSTMMAEVFARLKWENIDCELVTEFAKDLVWDGSSDVMKDEIYIFAEQNHRLFRVNGKVDVVVTDRPLILTVLYNNRYGEAGDALNNLVMSEFNKYNNLNILLKRTHTYNPIGRVQTEKEADEIAASIKEFLNENNIEYTEMSCKVEMLDSIIEKIKKRIGDDICNSQ